MNNIVKRKGAGFLEVVIATAVLSLVLFAFTFSLALYSRVGIEATQRSQALLLAEEGLEVVRGARDISWSTVASLAPDIEYGIEFDESLSRWSFVPLDVDADEVFTQRIILRDVHRSPSGDVVFTGGSYDGNARIVESLVSWGGAESLKEVRLESIISNIFE